MENFKIGLDKYLTTEPVDDFTPYCEEVYDCFSDEFYLEVYEKNSKFENSDLENKWLNKLFNKEVKPYKASKIIEKAYKSYNINKSL